MNVNAEKNRELKRTNPLLVSCCIFSNYKISTPCFFPNLTIYFVDFFDEVADEENMQIIADEIIQMPSKCPLSFIII